MTEARGEIIFLGLPSDIDWEAAPLLKALYSAGIHKISFTPVDDDTKEIEEVITAATKRASVVCVMSARSAGWQAREELLRKLLYRVSRKQLVLQEKGGLLPAGTSQFVDLNGIPLFMLPFTAVATHFTFSLPPQSTLLIMTPGTGATIYPFQSNIKDAIFLLPAASGGGCEGRWIRMSGVSPGAITEWIKKEPYYASVRFKIIPKVADLYLIIASEKTSSLVEAVSGIRKRFGRYCYSFDGESIEEAVGAALLAKGESLAVAESCTGGEIAAKITRIPGASRYFYGTSVTYSNRSKEIMLSIPHLLIHKKGSVSSEVASRMANGIRKNASADIGLSVTGIAGPTGATREKPVGLVYIALSSAQKTTVTRHRFYGLRDEIREQAVHTALGMVLSHFEENK